MVRTVPLSASIITDGISNIVKERFPRTTNSDWKVWENEVIPFAYWEFILAYFPEGFLQILDKTPFFEMSAGDIGKNPEDEITVLAKVFQCRAEDLIKVLARMRNREISPQIGRQVLVSLCRAILLMGENGRDLEFGRSLFSSFLVPGIAKFWLSRDPSPIKCNVEQIVNHYQSDKVVEIYPAELFILFVLLPALTNNYRR